MPFKLRYVFEETETLVPYSGGQAFHFQVVRTNIFFNLREPLIIGDTFYLNNAHNDLSSNLQASSVIHLATL